MINAPTMGTPNYLFDVAKGKVQNEQAINIFGFNRNIGSVFETIWNDTTSYTYPASASTLTVDSSNSSDTMQVMINGLDSDYNITSEAITLNGTSDVQTIKSFLRVNSAVILSGENQGDINIRSGSTIIAFIEQGIGSTQQCVYTVPNGHTLYLFRIDLTSGTVNGNKYLMYRNVIRKNSRTLRVAEATWQTGQQSFDRQVPFAISEKTDFEFEAKSSSGNNEVSIFIEAVLVKD